MRSYVYQIIIKINGTGTQNITSTLYTLCPNYVIHNTVNIKGTDCNKVDIPDNGNEINTLKLIWTNANNFLAHIFENITNIVEVDLSTYEEKETDVNIALKIFEDWIYDNYDKAIIVSGDSDIIPAIRRINDLAKKWKINNKEFSVLLFPWSKWKMIVKACNNNRLNIDSKHIENSLFPNKIDIWDWKFIRKPKSWK